MITNSVGATGRDYATLQAAWAALPATLTDDHTWELYNDAEFTAGLDNSAASKAFGAFTLTIKPASGQGFRDHASKLTNALRYNQSNGVAVADTPFNTPLINLTTACRVVIDGLQLKHTGYRAIETGGSTTVTVKNCVVQSGSTDPVAANGGASIINNVFIATNSGGGGLSIEVGSGIARNNTVVYIGSGTSSGVGVSANWGACTAIGNAVFGFTTAFNSANGGSYSGSSDYNATDAASIGTGQGTHNATSLTFANQFEAVGTLGSENLHLKAGNSLGSAGVYDASMDPDILGVSRNGSTPAIGAREPAGGGPSNAPRMYYMNRQRRR